MDDKYTAFISYRHHALDTAVATDVQHVLEHYRIPPQIRKQTGRKEIGRIFRDREELPTTSDINTSISTALREADFLILICSTHTAESTWVAREIDLFLQNHEKKQILTVIANGEPGEVIPELLLKDTRVRMAEDGTKQEEEYALEPLSCDYRLPRRQARREEIPRLAAAILGVSYDALRQRQHQYELRRRTAIFSAVLAAAAAFLIYFVISNRRISENLALAQHNQSVYLANEATRLADNNDTILSMELAVAACPDDTLQQDDLPELYRMMATQVKAYKNPNSWYFLSERLHLAFHGYQVRFTEIFDTAGRLLVFDERGKLTIADLDSYEIVNELSFPEADSGSADTEIVPYGKDKALFSYLTDGGINISCIGLEDGTVLWTRTHEVTYFEKLIPLSESESAYVLISMDSSYNPETGSFDEKIRMQRIKGEDSETALDTGLLLSSGDYNYYDADDVFLLGDGRSLFVRVGDGENKQSFIWDTETGAAADCPILADEREILDTASDNGGVTYFLCQRETENDGKAVSLAALDKSGNLLWDKDTDLTIGAYGSACMTIMPQSSGASADADEGTSSAGNAENHTVAAGAVLVATDTTAAVFNPASGALTDQMNIHADGLYHILSVSTLEDGTIFTFWDDGQAISLNFDEKTASRTFGASSSGYRYTDFFVRDSAVERQWVLAANDELSVYAWGHDGDDAYTVIEGSETPRENMNGGLVCKSAQRDDMLYLLDWNNTLTAVSMSEREIRWKKTVSLSEEDAESVYAMSLAEDGGMLFILSSEGRIFAFDTDTGDSVVLTAFCAENGYFYTDLILCGEYLTGTDGGYDDSTVFSCNLEAAAQKVFSGEKDADADIERTKTEALSSQPEVTLCDPERAVLLLYDGDTGAVSLWNMKDGTATALTSAGAVQADRSASLASSDAERSASAAPGVNSTFPTDSFVQCTAADPASEKIAFQLYDSDDIWCADETTGETVSIQCENKKIEGFFFCRDCLVLIADDSLLRYDKESGAYAGEVDTEDAPSMSGFSGGTEIVLDDERSLIQAPSYGSFLLVDTARWYVLQRFDAEAYYNGEIWDSGPIDTSGNSYGIYTYKLYSMDDLREKVKERLNGNALTAEDRGHYGIS